MKTAPLLSVAALLVLPITLQAGTTNLAELSLHRSQEAGALSWSGIDVTADGSVSRPYFEVQQSADLKVWQPVGQRVRLADTAASTDLDVSLPLDSANAFYRLLLVDPPLVTKLAQTGEELFGYADAFGQQLQRIGQITPAQFGSMYPNRATYSPSLSWEPTNALFCWRLVSPKEKAVNAGVVDFGNVNISPYARFVMARLASKNLGRSNGPSQSRTLRLCTPQRVAAGRVIVPPNTAPPIDT